MKLFRIVDPFTLTLVVTVLLASFFPARGGFVPFFEGLTTAAIALLFFIAGKLALNATDHLFGHGYEIDPNTSLIVVLVVLAIGIVASIIFPGKEEEQSDVNNDTKA